MGGVGAPHSHTLFSLRPQHQVEPDVSPQNALGAGSCRKHVHIGAHAGLSDMKEKKRIRTDVDTSEWVSPFAVLKNLNLPSSPASPATNENEVMVSPATKKDRGRVDILRQTAHRGGKTVTVVTNFTGVSQAEQKQLSKGMQKACGAGGTTKDGRIEIQGEHRETLARILIEAGFRPVFAGG